MPSRLQPDLGGSSGCFHPVPGLGLDGAKSVIQHLSLVRLLPRGSGRRFVMGTETTFPMRFGVLV